MGRRDRRREQWEQELRDMQGGLDKYGNFSRNLRRGYLFYSRWSGGRGLIRDRAHGLRFLAGVLIAALAAVLRPHWPGTLSHATAAIAFVAGLALAWSAFDFS